MSLPDGYETRFYAKVRQRHERERAEQGKSAEARATRCDSITARADEIEQEQAG